MRAGNAAARKEFFRCEFNVFATFVAWTFGNHNSKPICSQNGLNRRKAAVNKIPARLRTICRELDLIFPFFLENLSHRDRRQGRKPPLHLYSKEIPLIFQVDVVTMLSRQFEFR